MRIFELPCGEIQMWPIDLCDEFFDVRKYLDAIAAHHDVAADGEAQHVSDLCRQTRKHIARLGEHTVRHAEKRCLAGEEFLKLLRYRIFRRESDGQTFFCEDTALLGHRESLATLRLDDPAIGKDRRFVRTPSDGMHQYLREIPAGFDRCRYDLGKWTRRRVFDGV